MKARGAFLAVAALITCVFVVAGGVEVEAKKRRRTVASSRLVDIAVVTGFADTLDSPRGFVDLNEATAQVTAERGGILLVRFASESHCRGSKTGYCSVRVLVDGQESDPIDSSGTYYDSTGGGGRQSRAIERSVRDLDRGRHQVVVQWATFGDPETSFEMGAWHLTVESIKDGFR